MGPFDRLRARLFVGSRTLCVRLRFLRMTAKIRGKVKGIGQECPIHTGFASLCFLAGAGF